MTIKKWPKRAGSSAGGVPNRESGNYIVESSAKWQKSISKPARDDAVLSAKKLGLDSDPTVSNLTLSPDSLGDSSSHRNDVGYDPYDTGRFDAAMTYPIKPM